VRHGLPIADLQAHAIIRSVGHGLAVHRNQIGGHAMIATKGLRRLNMALCHELFGRSENRWPISRRRQDIKR
jgi:hypothetical protein